MILLSQIFYYRRRGFRLPGKASEDNESTETDCETTPLLEQRDANLSAYHGKYTKVLGYLASITFIILVGVIAWCLAGTTEKDPQGGEEDIIEWKSQLFGWSSAVLYRKPSLNENFKTELKATIFFLVASRFPQIGVLKFIHTGITLH
jgi:hypothetical protein